MARVTRARHNERMRWRTPLLAAIAGFLLVASACASGDNSAGPVSLAADAHAQALLADGKPEAMQLYAGQLLDQGAVAEGAAMAVLSVLTK